MPQRKFAFMGATWVIRAKGRALNVDIPLPLDRTDLPLLPQTYIKLESQTPSGLLWKLHFDIEKKGDRVTITCTVEKEYECPRYLLTIMPSTNLSICFFRRPFIFSRQTFHSRPIGSWLSRSWLIGNRPIGSWPSHSWLIGSWLSRSWLIQGPFVIRALIMVLVLQSSCRAVWKKWRNRADLAV